MKTELVTCATCKFFELTHVGIRSGNCHESPQVVRVLSTYWCGKGKAKK